MTNHMITKQFKRVFFWYVGFWLIELVSLEDPWLWSMLHTLGFYPAYKNFSILPRAVIFSEILNMFVTNNHQANDLPKTRMAKEY